MPWLSHTRGRYFDGVMYQVGLNLRGVLCTCCGFSIGFEKGVFWKRGLFRKVHFLEIPENLEILEETPDCGNKGRIRPFARDSREFRHISGSRDSSSEKTPFVMTRFPFPIQKVKMHIRHISNLTLVVVQAIIKSPKHGEKATVVSKKIVGHSSGKKEAHELKRNPRDTAKDTRRDKQGSTGRCPRDFLLVHYRKIERNGNFCWGHRPGVLGTPGHPGRFQTFYRIFSDAPLMLPNSL